jgi:transglutaminase-like putative cysteine protease
MKIRVGYDITMTHVQYTPLVLLLNIHESRAADILVPDTLFVEPAVSLTQFRDCFGNLNTRLIAPPGQIRFHADAIIADPGSYDYFDPNAIQHDVASLPDDCLQFLLGSRYCEPDTLMDFAWANFNTSENGYGRVKRIVDFVHDHLTFGYQYARKSRNAWEAFNERVGVCRDFAHLAITLCRAMNIPARYCTGYLGDIGVPRDPAPMDFSAWFEAYIGNHWHTFDARHNQPRIGRVLIARGRDAADTAISTVYGPSILNSFKIFTEEQIAVAA